MSENYKNVKCEVCGKSFPWQIVTHLREAHEMSVADYRSKDKFPLAPVLHVEVDEYLRDCTIVLDAEGNPWRAIPRFEEMGFQGFGRLFNHPATPSLDKKYRFDPMVTKLVYLAFEANQRLLLAGPPGTGKSEMVRNMCALLGWGYRRVNFNGAATPRTFIGSPRAANGNTYFQYGALPQAMLNGECLLLDEVSFIDSDMAASLHEPLEKGGCLTLLENGGEVIRPHKDFRVFGTDNVGMQGDMTGRFHGTKPLNAAFMDRWTTQVNVGYMDKKTEASVLVSKTPGLPDAVALKMTAIADESRVKSRDEEMAEPLTFRMLMDWAELAVQHRSIGVGWKYAVLNKVSEESAGVLRMLFDHKFPEVRLDV